MLKHLNVYDLIYVWLFKEQISFFHKNGKLIMNLLIKVLNIHMVMG